MQILISLLVVYASGLLLLRNTISAHLVNHSNIIWLDLFIGALFLFSLILLVLHRPFRVLGLPRNLFIVSVAVTTITIAGFTQLDFGRKSGATPIAAIATTGMIETRLNRAWDGHFRAIAKIDNTDVGMMVDTGASLVLLRFDDAMRMGIDPATLSFSVPLTTAGGRSHVAPYVFETIRIGDVVVHNIAGAIAENGILHSSLLGMTFLEQLTETVIRHDVMIFRK